MAEGEAEEVPLRAKNVLVRHPDGVECFEARWRRQRTRPHAHPEYQLTWTLSGAGLMHYRGGRARIPSGCMALFHPGEPHVIENERRQVWWFRVLHLPESLVRPHVPLLQPAPFGADASLARAFEALFRAVIEQAALGASATRLTQLLAARPGLEPESSATAQVVRRALGYLAANLDRPVPLAELARVCGAPGERLRRLFVATTGIGPHAWHLQRRIQHAKQLLSGGGAPAEVAGLAGFADQAHLTRHFTKLVGVSPARYAGPARKARRSG